MEEKRYYVYVHTDETGNICYIGHGTGNRLNHVSGRTAAHKEKIAELNKTILKDNLTKDEAIKLENEMLLENINNPNLLNVKKTSRPVKPVEYELLKEYFYIDETSPSGLRWSVDIKSWDGHKSQVKAGQVAGTLTKLGYWETNLDKVCYKVHRIVWALFNKQNTPTNKIIDHINRDRSDNSPENLRLVSPEENALNGSLRKNNTSGVKGVCWGKDKRGRYYWSASWRECGKNKTKKFFPMYLFKGMPIEESKQLALLVAKEFREEKIKQLYGESYE